MLRYGTISEVKPEKGLARVRFEEDDIVSGWLQITQPNTLGDKAYRSLKVNEHVACLMDTHAENGVIIGAIYNKQDTPAYTGEKCGVKFEDGTEIIYDKAEGSYLIKLNSGKLIIETPSDVELTCAKLKVTGDVEVTGKIDASSDITSETEVTAGPLAIKLTTHKHIGVQPGPGTTGTPVP